MKDKMVDEDGVSRRNFIRAAALTAVAATATGAGAALMRKETAVVLPPPQITNTTLPTTNTLVPANTETADLWSRLVEAQAENMRLQSSLSAMERQVSALEEQIAGKGSATEQLTVELATANQQVGTLAGLVALYEQLDEIDLATVWDEGVTAVTESITEWVEDMPSLDEGIEMGRQALDHLEEHIPLLENGRIWLTSQRDKLQLYYQVIEALLAAAVEAAAPFLEMLNEWFQKINRWLPFNIGQQATEIMASITSLLAETPHTVSGLDTNLAQPLDIWLNRDGDETILQRDVVKPIRQNVLDKAKGVTAKAQQVQTVYETQLVAPTQTAVSNQKVVRILIAQYREQHQI